MKLISYKYMLLSIIVVTFIIATASIAIDPASKYTDTRYTPEQLLDLIPAIQSAKKTISEVEAQEYEVFKQSIAESVGAAKEIYAAVKGIGVIDNAGTIWPDLRTIVGVAANDATTEWWNVYDNLLKTAFDKSLYVATPGDSKSVAAVEARKKDTIDRLYKSRDLLMLPQGDEKAKKIGIIFGPRLLAAYWGIMQQIWQYYDAEWEKNNRWLFDAMFRYSGAYDLQKQDK